MASRPRPPPLREPAPGQQVPPSRLRHQRRWERLRVLPQRARPPEKSKMAAIEEPARKLLPAVTMRAEPECRIPSAPQEVRSLQGPTVPMAVEEGANLCRVQCALRGPALEKKPLAEPLIRSKFRWPHLLSRASFEPPVMPAMRKYRAPLAQEPNSSRPPMLERRVECWEPVPTRPRLNLPGSKRHPARHQICERRQVPGRSPPPPRLPALEPARPGANCRELLAARCFAPWPSAPRPERTRARRRRQEPQAGQQDATKSRSQLCFALPRSFFGIISVLTC